MGKPEAFGFLLLLAVIFFGLINGVSGSASSSVNIGTRTVIGNAAPLISSLELNAGNPIILVAGGTSTVTASFQVIDYNGCNDVFSGGNVTATIHRSDVSDGCTSSLFNCIPSASLTYSCIGNNTAANATATFRLYYFAGSSDASSSQPSTDWIAHVDARDSANATGTANSAGVELGTLLAIDTLSPSINYGTVAAGQNTGSTNQKVSFFVAGNSSATLKISGTALSGGGNSIATGSQRFASTTFSFGGTEQVLSDALTAVSGWMLKFGANWLTASQANFLPLPFAYGEPASDDRYLYAIGGIIDGSGNPTSTVSYASVAASGTLNGWSVTQSLPVPISFGGGAIYGGHVYVAGGLNTSASSSATTSVFYATQASDGSLSSWTAGTSLPAATRDHQLVALNGYLYLLGGRNAAGTATTTVLSAPLNGDGSIGSWSATTGLPGARERHAAIVYRDRIYVSGGVSGTPQTAVWYATPSGGTISSWSSATPLRLDLYSHGMVAAGDILYALGGVTATILPSNLTIYAPILADGSLGEQWSYGNLLPNEQYGQGVGVVNGYAFSFGGVQDSVVTSTVAGASLSSRNLYWGLEVPGGLTVGTLNGTITAAAVWSP